MLDLSITRAATLLLPEATGWRFVLVGCGGTGSWLAPSIARIGCELRDQGKKVEITFVDPDTVEEGNIPRQNFCRADLGENKARALAYRYGAGWGIEILARPTRFDPDAFGHGWARGRHPEVTILIGCVDNAAARQAIAKATAARDGYWWLDCGNADESGQVLFGNMTDVKTWSKADAPASRKICTALPAPSLTAPDLLVPRPEEALARRRSCAEVAAANFQSLAVNQMVASIATDYLLRITGGGLRRFGTWFDLAAGSMRSRYNTEEEFAAFRKVRKNK